MGRILRGKVSAGNMAGEGCRQEKRASLGRSFFLPAAGCLETIIRFLKTFSHGSPLRLQGGACEHFICLQIFLNGPANHIFGQNPVVSGVCFQPVPGKLLVEGRLAVAGFVAVRRPEAGAVRRQHFVCQNNAAIFVQAEFKFCVCYDNAPFQSVLRTFFVQCDGIVPELCCILGAFSRVALFQIVNALVVGDVLVVVADLCFGGGGVCSRASVLGMDSVGGLFT